MPTTVTDDTPAAAALRAIELAPADRPFVVAQLGQSLDGRIATPTGESRWINGAAALDHVHRLRAAVDAVVVGIGTALADDPILNVRRVTGRNPARVVIDPRGRLPAAARCLDGADGARRLVIRAGDPRSGASERSLAAAVGQSSPVSGGGLAAGVEVMILDAPAGQMAPRAIVDSLYECGLRKLLIEGGASTVSAFIDADVVDRLHVLVAPMILGSGKTGLSLMPITKLTQALRPQSGVHVLGDGDVLFDCDLRSVQRGS